MCGKVRGRGVGNEGEGASAMHLERAPEEASRRMPATLDTPDAGPDTIVPRCNASESRSLVQFLIGFRHPFTVRQPPKHAPTLTNSL